MEQFTVFSKNSPLTYNTGVKAKHTAYSDRLFQESPERYNAACMKAFGNEGQYSPEEVLKKLNYFFPNF